MRLFGLIGYPLSHSFSKEYFARKFAAEGIRDCRYENFSIPQITAFPLLLEQHPDLEGVNVTIPYKEQVIPYLDAMNDAARQIGAVNCIQIREGKKKGFNTDVIGFKQSLLPLLGPRHRKALILGTGGGAKAVAYVLHQLKIPFYYVSRKKKLPGTLQYDELDAPLLKTHTLIVNTTPLGMSPQVEAAPPIPYELLTAQHLLYDLIYNPDRTLFLQRGAAAGASIKNGYEMLVLQAEASWDIWNAL